MRPNSGPFNVTLDGKTTLHNAVISGAAEFQQVLFNATGLSSDTHELVLTNAGTGTFVDIDYIMFTTGDGDARWVTTASKIFPYGHGLEILFYCYVVQCYTYQFHPRRFVASYYL